MKEIQTNVKRMQTLCLLDILLYITIFPSLSVNQTDRRSLDVGGMQAFSKTMQNYSFPPSDKNRETEPRLLAKHVGVRTPGEHGRWAGFATEQNNHVLSTRVMDLQRGTLIHTQSSLPGYCKCPRLLGSLRLGMAWKWQQSSVRLSV